jgi:hypothetical protein
MRGIKSELKVRGREGGEEKGREGEPHRKKELGGCVVCLGLGMFAF